MFCSLMTTSTCKKSNKKFRKNTEERKRAAKNDINDRNYTKESTFLVTKVEELNDIRAGLATADVVLLLKCSNS